MRFAIIILLALGCGASAREKTISTALASTDIASKSFETFDLSHQKAILDSSKDETSYKLAIGEYRGEQSKVEKLFASLYRAIATAATLNTDQSLESLARATSILIQELQSLGVIP